MEVTTQHTLNSNVWQRWGENKAAEFTSTRPYVPRFNGELRLGFQVPRQRPECPRARVRFGWVLLRKEVSGWVICCGVRKIVPNMRIKAARCPSSVISIDPDTAPLSLSEELPIKSGKIGPGTVQNRNTKSQRSGVRSEYQKRSSRQLAIFGGGGANRPHSQNTAFKMQRLRASPRQPVFMRTSAARKIRATPWISEEHGQRTCSAPHPRV